MPAYFLYSEIDFLTTYTRKSPTISSTELCKMTGITRKHQFHDAKNALAQSKLLAHDNFGYNKPNTYKIIKRPPATEQFISVPWVVWHYLLKLKLKKILTPNSFYIYLRLFSIWTIKGRQERTEFAPIQLKRELNAGRMTIGDSLISLNNIGLIKRHVNARTTLCELFLPSHLKFTARKGRVSYELSTDAQKIINHLLTINKKG